MLRWIVLVGLGREADDDAAAGLDFSPAMSLAASKAMASRSPVELIVSISVGETSVEVLRMQRSQKKGLHDVGIAEAVVLLFLQAAKHRVIAGRVSNATSNGGRSVAAFRKARDSSRTLRQVRPTCKQTDG